MSAAIAKGQKNDFRDAEAITEAVQRPTMKFLAMKTADQLDPQALHRVRERLVSQRTGIINQIRAFLLERGTAVRQGQRFLRAHLPRILAMPSDVLSPRSHVCAGETVPLAPTYARVSSTTLAYAETVGSQFLSLRQSFWDQLSLSVLAR
jgi:transposase